MEEIVTTISEDLGFKSLGAKVILPPFPNEQLPLANLNDLKINNEADMFVATCSNQIIFGGLQKLRDFILSENDAENDLLSYNFTILNDIIKDDKDGIIFVDILYNTKQIVVITLCGKLFFIDFETSTTLNLVKQINSDTKILKCLTIADTLYYIDSNYSLKYFQFSQQNESQILIPDNVADFDKILNTNKLVVLTRNDCELQFYNILKGTLSLENTFSLPEDITSIIQQNDDGDKCIPLNVVTLYHNQYLLVFGNSPNPDSDTDAADDDIDIVYDHKTYIVKLDPNNKPTYYETFDLAPAFGVVRRLPSIYNIVLPNLVDGISNFNIVTSSCSTELSIWDSNEIVQPDQDSERAVLPISKETDNDTCPIGMALDYYTHGSIADPCSGVDSVDRLPLIYILNNEGRLLIWGFYHSYAIKNKTFHVENVASFYKDQNMMVLPDTIKEKQGGRDISTIEPNESDEFSIFTKKDDQTALPTTNTDTSESIQHIESDIDTSSKDNITKSFGSFSLAQMNNSDNNTGVQKPSFGFSSSAFGNSISSPFKIPNNTESNKRVFGQSAFGSSAFTQNNNSNLSDNQISVFGKPAFGKPSFGQSQVENTNGSATESVFGKPAFGKPSFSQSQVESTNGSTMESSFGKPAFGKFSFGNTEFGKSSFANVDKKESPFAKLSKNESPFANIAKKESSFANITAGESQNFTSEEIFDFRKTGDTEIDEKSKSDDEKVEEAESNDSKSETDDELNGPAKAQTPPVPLQNIESKFSLSDFADSLKKTANISTTDITNTKFGQFNNDNIEKSLSPFASFANNLKKTDSSSFSFSNFNINDKEEREQIEVPNNGIIDDNKNDENKVNSDLWSDEVKHDSDTEKDDDESKIDDISKLDLKDEQGSDIIKDYTGVKETGNVDNEANEFSGDLMNKTMLQENQPVDKSIKEHNASVEDKEVFEPANHPEVNNEREDTKLVLTNDEHLDKKDGEVDDKTNLSTIEILTEIPKNKEHSEHVVVEDKEDKDDKQVINKLETTTSEIPEEKSDGSKKPQLADKSVNTTVQSVSQQIQTEPIECKDLGIQMGEFASQSCQTDEIKYKNFQINSFEEDENYLAEVYMPLSLDKYYTNAIILNIPYASTDKIMRLFENTYQQVNAEFQVLEDNLKSMKSFIEDQETINLERRTEQSIGNKYTWRIPEVKQLFEIIQKRQLKVDEISKSINELDASILMCKRKESVALLQQRDETKERYGQIDYLKTELLNNRYAPLNYHQSSLKRTLRQKMLNLDKQSEEINQCLYISKSFVNYLTDPLNIDIKLLLMSAEYFDTSNKLKSKPLDVNIARKMSQDKIQSLDVVQIGLNINAKKQMGEFFKKYHSQRS